jgi:hypothetical protein
MKKILIAVLLVAVFSLAFAAPVFAGGNGAIVGEYDTGGPLGVISYVGNPAGYHLWFTCNTDVTTTLTDGSSFTYEAGHSYHNIYKFKVKDTDKWGYHDPANPPANAPYNIVNPDGDPVYLKIIDITADGKVFPVFP